LKSRAPRRPLWTEEEEEEEKEEEGEEEGERERERERERVIMKQKDWQRKDSRPPRPQQICGGQEGCCVSWL